MNQNPETLMSTNQSARRHNPKYNNRNTHVRKKLKYDNFIRNFMCVK